MSTEGPAVIIGTMNRLSVLQTEAAFDADNNRQIFLDGGELGPIELMTAAKKPRTREHNSTVPPSLVAGDALDVFVYRDVAKRLLASRQAPLALVGECACLEVVDLSNAGAFLEWGLPQHLLLPKSRQQSPLRIGQRCVVFLELDQSSERVIASSKLSRHLSETPDIYTVDDQVNIMIADATHLGFKVVIDGKYLGLLYRNEVFQDLHAGQQLEAYIKDVRSDGKIDLKLSANRKETSNALGDAIIAHLKKNRGRSPLNDHSEPEQIYKIYKTSKKTYKRAISALYKERRIVIDENGIGLNTEAEGLAQGNELPAKQWPATKRPGKKGTSNRNNPKTTLAENKSGNPWIKN